MFLARHGLGSIRRNVVVGRGELDLVVRNESELVGVEVKTRYLPEIDPIENFTVAKRAQVRSLARASDPPIHRVDFVGVSLWTDCVEIRWLPGV